MFVVVVLVGFLVSSLFTFHSMQHISGHAGLSHEKGVFVQGTARDMKNEQQSVYIQFHGKNVRPTMKKTKKYSQNTKLDLKD